jgi:uncharacterized protein YndB with AHSA1/START domain
MSNLEKITIEAIINRSSSDLWTLWTQPEHITKWNQASDDWHSPRAENDLRVGGRFLTRMEAKDGSMGFDFSGTYTEIVKHQKIHYTMDDDREVETLFNKENSKTKITITFDAENENPMEMQRDGWQAILNSFKKYAEVQKGD